MDNHVFSTKGAKVIKEHGIIVGLHGLSGLPCPTCKSDTGFNPWNSASWHLVHPMGRDMPDVTFVADCDCPVCIASNKMSSSDRYFHRKVLCHFRCTYKFKCELAACDCVVPIRPGVDQADFQSELAYHYKVRCRAETKCLICSEELEMHHLCEHYGKHALDFATKFVNKEFPAINPSRVMLSLAEVADPWTRALKIKADASGRSTEDERKNTSPVSLLAFFHAAGRKDVYPTYIATLVMKSQCWDGYHSTLQPFRVIFGKYYRKEEEDRVNNNNGVVVLDG
jgi:hypothetical protein